MKERDEDVLERLDLLVEAVGRAGAEKVVEAFKGAKLPTREQIAWAHARQEIPEPEQRISRTTLWRRRRRVLDRAMRRGAPN